MRKGSPTMRPVAPDAAPIESPPAVLRCDWPGTSRYRVDRVLGQGGMGLVYEAFDRDRGTAVALKTIRHFDPAALFRFKQEFRALADVRHPNLVRLFELVVSEADGAFFTMELVRGSTFADHVRTRPAARRPDVEEATITAAAPARYRGHYTADVPGELWAPSGDSSEDALFSYETLRSAFRQLVEGVQALHAAGYVHRDIKPPNVLVDAGGRVVILDLGVAASFHRGAGNRARAVDEIVGTANYMSPEQGFGESPTPAADWYSVGAMLYEALVGCPPFVGAAFEVLSQKSLTDPIPPSVRVPSVPVDLDTLCVALLKRDPLLRPVGRDVMRALNQHNQQESGQLPSPVPGPHSIRDAWLFGREEPLRQLREAFESSSHNAVTVEVGGPSGMGKSTLTHHFVEGLLQRGDTLILRGRAYERESVPYKGLDSVVDELSLFLESLGNGLELPQDFDALVRVFPVLGRLPGIKSDSDLLMNAFDLRRRAFAALRALLGTLGRSRRLVLVVDDAQWGDADSAALILELVRPPDAPPILLVLAYRQQEAERSPFFRHLREGWQRDAELRTVVVDPLRPDDAQALAQALLGTTDEFSRRTARAVARESGGSPFFIGELVRSNWGADPRRPDDAPPAVTVDQMVVARLAQLPDDARTLTEIVAVGGRPLPVGVVAEALGVDAPIDGIVAVARSRRFLHAGLRDGQEMVEMSHDRFRESILARLAPERLREHHSRLARVLQAAPRPDTQAIALHLLGAGELEGAALYAARAADQALEKLAFDQAARLLETALAGGYFDEPSSRAMRLRRAEALANAGRASAAADLYLEAARGAGGAERVEIERAAAAQLVTCGRVDEGTVALRRVLGAVGLRAPRSALGALVWLLVYRLAVSIRGLGFVERTPDQVSQQNRVRIEALNAVATGLGMVDVILGACMQARHLLLALRHGDVSQVQRALCIHWVHLATEGRSEGSRQERALSRVLPDLSAKVGPDAVALLELTRALGVYLRGRYAETIAAFDEAPTLIRHIPGDANGELFVCWALYFAGRLREEGVRARRFLRDVEERGDLYTSVSLRLTAMVDLCLADDDVDAARKHLREASEAWTQSGFRLQHWLHMLRLSWTELYAGCPREAWAGLVQKLKPLKRSLLLHSAYVAMLNDFTVGMVAIAAAAVAPALERPALVAEGRRRAQTLAKLSPFPSAALATLLRAGLANVAGDFPTALLLLQEAALKLDGVGMALYAAAARRRRGQLLGGHTGEALVRESDWALLEEGVRAPARWVNIVVPGSWPVDSKER